jgi:2,4-dienoyl-CoA reductase-like NADH-dependent reductase (Old Yellow Enzyme family)
MSLLFSPYRLKNVLLKNRLVVSPMCQYSSVDGFATNWHLVHLGSRAAGQVGMIISEATAVSPEGRISPDDLGIWKDEHIEKLRQITTFIAEQACVPAIQLAHAGRKASTFAPWKGHGAVPLSDGGWQTVSASDLSYSEHYHQPIQLNAEGIHKVISDFKNAARRAVEAGFKVIELHAAHGYLIHQFLSPLSNHRTDQYGGTFSNRILLLLEIIDAVQLAIPEEIPLIVRISATDWVEDGWNLDQSIELCKILQTKNIDLIDVSTGGLSPHQQIPIQPSYQVPFSEAIRQQALIATSTVGLINNAEEAEKILQERQADLIFMGRKLLRDPYFALQAADELGEEIQWPNQYLRSKLAKK